MSEEWLHARNVRAARVKKGESRWKVRGWKIRMREGKDSFKGTRLETKSRRENK
jgi:hypothetical protein